MRDDRGLDSRAVSLGELRRRMREAGVGRAFGRDLRRRVPGAARALLATGIGMVVLSLGSVYGVAALRAWFGFELQPVYQIHSFRWWAEQLVVIGVVVGLPLSVVSAAVCLVARRREWRRAIVAVELGFCGGCGYRLGGLVPESDGCVVCPECGAAWRVSREVES